MSSGTSTTPKSKEQPLLLQNELPFQQQIPAVEQHYSLVLPAQWEYRAVWLNHPEIRPSEAGSNHWEWPVRNIPGIRAETDMPPWSASPGR